MYLTVYLMTLIAILGSLTVVIRHPLVHGSLVC